MTKRYNGEVVYLYAYDLAYDMKPASITELLGQTLSPFRIDPGKRSPRETFMQSPLMASLPERKQNGPDGPVQVRYIIKLLPLGAVSICVRVPFRSLPLSDLVRYHDVALDGKPLNQEVFNLATKVLEELKPFCIRPPLQLADDEAYTVFCIENPSDSENAVQINSESWLEENRPAVAALLTQEAFPIPLSRQEIWETTNCWLSYYQRDLAVVDWDAALLLDLPGQYDESLFVLELANLQLAELVAYDRLLDDAMERSYRDLIPQGYRAKKVVIQQLRELRIDLARFSDELSNITKFFGDWHLARLYSNVSTRFHLSDWHSILDEKLQTLGDLYEILKQDQGNRLMLLLEITIVWLFIIDLVIIVVLGIK